MTTEQGNTKKLALSWGQWVLVVLGGTLLLVAAVVVVPKALKITLDLAQIGSYVVGAVSVSIASYAAISTNNLKKFEIQRGYAAAMTLLHTDVVEALNIVKSIHSRVEGIKDKAAWNELVEDLQVNEKRYEKKHDQLPTLSTYFKVETFLSVRELYLEIQAMWLRSDALSLAANTANDEVDALLPKRKAKLAARLNKSVQALAARHKELGLQSLPPNLRAVITAASAQKAEEIPSLPA